MSLLVITIRLHHACPLSGPVESAPGLRVAHLCHRGKQVLLEVRGRDEARAKEAVQTYGQQGGKTLFDDPGGTSAMLSFPTCGCCNTGLVIPSMERAGYLYLPPTIYDERGETYEFLGSRATDAQQVLRDLEGQVQVSTVFVRPLNRLGGEEGLLVPTGTLFGDISPRQREALFLAMSRGYYRIPRAVRTADLAKVLGISRPAFEALLRKAENKLISSVGPFLPWSGPSPLPSEPGASAPREERKAPDLEPTA